MAPRQVTVAVNMDDDETLLTDAATLSPCQKESYVTSTIALCFCMLTHSYLLISVFPYSGYLAVELIESATPETAGSYAGWIASAFMVGRATTAYLWGQVADRYGRTVVLYISLGLSSLISILFGLAPNFAMALFIRFLLGASNGIMGTIKTTVSELADGDESLETTMMSTVVGLWGWGFLLSPAISGWLAEPLKQYPDVEWLQRDDGFVHRVLSAHPFLLPNVLGAFLCLLALLTVFLFVRETLPDDQRRSPSLLVPDLFRRMQMLWPFSRQGQGYRHLSNEDNSDPFSERDPTNDGEHTDLSHSVVATSTVTSPPPTTIAKLLSRPQTRTCLTIYWAYSFVGLTVDEAFPLFCISQQAGFGLSENKIGKILSLCGLLFAVSQYFVTTAIYRRFGLYGAIRAGTLLSAPMMLLVPLSRLLNRGAADGELKTGTFVFLALVMALYRVFALVFFSNISVAANRTVPVSERATMNGLSVFGGSITKALGPIVAGFLVSLSVARVGNAASLVIFGAIGVLGYCVVALTFLVLRDVDEEKMPHEPFVNTAECTVQEIEMAEAVSDIRP